MTEAGHRRHQWSGLGELSHTRLVKPRVGPSVDPVNQAVDPRPAQEDVDAADHLAGRQKVDLDRVVHSPSTPRLHVTAVETATEDPRGLSLTDHFSVLVTELVSVTTVAPVQAAIGSQEAAVDTRRVATEPERVDQDRPFVGNPVVVEITKPPDIGWAGHVQRPAMPQRSHRQGHLVGEDRAAVENPVSVGVGDHPDQIGGILDQVGRANVLAGTRGDKQSTTVIKAGQHRVFDQRRSGRHLDRETLGHTRQLVSRLQRQSRDQQAGNDQSVKTREQLPAVVRHCGIPRSRVELD